MKFTPTTSTSASLGSAFGTGLAQPIDEAFKLLTQKKLMQIQGEHKSREAQQQKQKLLQANTPIFGKEVSEWLVQQDPQVQKTILQNPAALFQIQDILRSENNENPMTDQLLGKKQNANLEDQNDIDAFSALENINKRSQQPQQEVGSQPMGLDRKRSALSEALTPPHIKLQQNKEKREIENLELKKQKAERDIKQEKKVNKAKQFKENKAFVNTALSNEKSAKQNDFRINNMEKLIDRGNLPNAALWNFLTKIEDQGALSGAGAGGGIGAAAGTAIGGPIGGAIGAAIGGLAGSVAGPLAGAVKSVIRKGSPDIEEFEKLSADFIKNAKQFFGSRVTDFDLRSFMNTIPNLMQTDAGKKKIIDNFRALNDAVKLEGKITRDIIKENGGVPPYDLEIQVFNRLDPEMDKLAQLFTVK